MTIMKISQHFKFGGFLPFLACYGRSGQGGRLTKKGLKI